MLGFFFVYLLGTITTWRNVSMICLALPLATMVAISFVGFSIQLFLINVLIFS